MISQRQRSQSVTSHRRRRLLQVIFAVLLLALAVAAGFYLGQQAAYSGMGMDEKSYRSMQRELPVVRRELKALQGDLQVQRTRNKVDSKALEMLRQEIAGQKERTADLEEGLRFYKGLMAPAEVANGLRFRAPELVVQAESGRYAYRIVVQQEALKHEMVKGSLQVEVFGLLGGQNVTYPLTELSGDLEDGALILQFRYFQAVTGELSLPEGFKPEGMNLVATVRKPRKTEVREQFPWHIQERFTHVGK